jgi:hypothetical protein
VTREDPFGPDAVACLREEILRWNPVVNLVTRRATATALDLLLGQCREGFRLLSDEITASSLRALRTYVDLGSGNGLPGLLWGTGLRGLGFTGAIVLVEPRQRRAWFLARTARLMGLAGVQVIAHPWGDPAAGRTPVGDTLVSIKALRLTDRDVLAGLGWDGRPGTDGSLSVPGAIVARFLGPGESTGDPEWWFPGGAEDLPADWRAGEPAHLCGDRTRLVATRHLYEPAT